VSDLDEVIKDNARRGCGGLVFGLILAVAVVLGTTGRCGHQPVPAPSPTVTRTVTR